MPEHLLPVVPGQTRHPNKKAGPPTIWATSSGRGYHSVEAINLALLASASRGHTSPDIEAYLMSVDLPAGKAYAIPCPKEAQGAYLFIKGRTGRTGWVRLVEVYDTFNMEVPPQMQLVIPVTLEEHPKLGRCIALDFGKARLRSRRARVLKALQEAAPASQP